MALCWRAGRSFWGCRRACGKAVRAGKELLVDLKARGLSIAPDIAVGDGALGFWKALEEAFPSTRHQRCWQHKSLNVLDKLPKSVQPNAHRDLREIWLSENRAAAEAAMTIFAEKYAPKYDKAVDCLLKDRDALFDVLRFPRGALDASSNVELKAPSQRFGIARFA